MMNCDYDLHSYIRLKEIPKLIWKCDTQCLKEASHNFLSSCVNMVEFISIKLSELREVSCDDVTYDALKHQLTYWEEDIPEAMKELTSTLINYLCSDSITGKKLFILNLTRYKVNFCNDIVTTFFNGKFIPHYLLEELLENFCQKTNCEMRVNLFPEKAYAVIPKLETEMECTWIKEG